MKNKGIVWEINNQIFSFCKRYVNRYNNENNDNIHNNGELRLMRLLLPHCKVVFDIGANLGDWTVLALKINPRLKIHCFEPSVTTFQYLRTRNFNGKVILNNFGLSSMTRNLPLYVFKDGAGLNSLYMRHGLDYKNSRYIQTKTELIRVETLDGYCQRTNISSIDFLKVDVEGHELEVFKGASVMLSQGKIKQIQFEYGGCNIDAGVLLKDLFEFFVPYQYDFYKIYQKNLQHILRYDQRLENYQYKNFLLIHKNCNKPTI
ncbi:MAG: FkbM family methyltransferase [Candidatus Omnitrophota bacterium]